MAERELQEKYNQSFGAVARRTSIRMAKLLKYYHSNSGRNHGLRKSKSACDRKTFRQIQDWRRRSDAMRIAPPAGGDQ